MEQAITGSYSISTNQSYSKMGSVVYDMAERIIENLHSVADQSCGRSQGRCFNIALQKLEDEISSIRKVAVDAEKKQAHDQEVRDWLAKVEDALHDVDNLADEFRSTSRRSSSGKKIIREVGNFFSSSCQLVFWRKFDHNIKKCMEELHNLREIGSSLKLEEQSEEVAFDGLWKSISSPPSQNTNIGRENEKEKILKRLSGSIDDRESLAVLPIVGTAGVGKTMLAQLVYNDDMVRNRFDLRMWLPVSKSWNINWIYTEVVQSAIDSTNDMNSLMVIGDIEFNMAYVREKIATKRFLLVLDDVWMNEYCEDAWGNFKAHLEGHGAKKGSRIIVTTRDETVARMTGTMESFPLSGLPEDQSWSVFVSFFPDRQLLSDVLISETGKNIVNSCKGNPFAIRAISGMLLFKDPETKWQSMERELSQRFQNEEDVSATTVELSYNDLPSNLKKCFAYCSLFPRDYEIDVQTVIKLWMSEGLIRQEDVGYECFLKLLWRSFFNESKRDEEDKVTKCKMQNLMHDHAKFLFRNRFITFGSNFEGEIIDVKRMRHVSFDLHLDSLWQIPNTLLDAKDIRTIVLPSQLRWEIGGRSDESICGKIVSKFKCLRTLDLHNSGIKAVPDSISELKFLRYLDLSQNRDIKALPKSFTKLQYLQTLKLSNCGRLRKLPEDIEKLINLRNLEINSCHSLTHMPRGLGKLTHLQILSEFVSTVSEHYVDSAGGLNELSTLNNLRGELRVKNLSPEARTEEANLRGKQFLRSLMLIWDFAAADKFDVAQYEKSLEGLQPHSNLKELSLSAYGGTRFPRWLPSHTNLVKFFLWRCTKSQHIPQLNHLPCLEVLVLEDMTELEYISENHYSSAEEFFPSLKELRLTNLQKLKKWWGPEEGQNRRRRINRVEESVRFPCLSKLIIEDCPWLSGSMPRFPDLKELLVLKNTSWEPFKQTINAGQEQDSISTIAASSSRAPNSTPSTPLSNLTTLCFVNMPFANPEMLQSLSSLCSFPRLCSLTLDDLTDVKKFLDGFQHVTGLQELHIWRCLYLREIPTWTHLSSLQKLSIRLCPNLTIPPERISLVTSIQKVEIEDCLQISSVENLLNDRFFRR